MPVEESAVQGAQNILEKGFGLKENEELLIIGDETTLNVLHAFDEAAYKANISLTIIFVPVAMQRRDEELSVTFDEAIRNASNILTCVNGEPDCYRFRRAVLQRMQFDKRLGHMPGADLNVLELANVDYDELTRDCKRLAVALARGKTLELHSTAFDGTPHKLTVDIGGWRRLPIASDGVLQPGVWGNIPSGETYIAPMENTAEGSVVINGSIPNYVIPEGGDLILNFAKGRLTTMEPPNGAAARHLQETEIEPATLKNDTEWSNLAEVGIGVNKKVAQLTGNMLYDEKAAGTAHVALGGNSNMGGHVDSTIHTDMAIRKPSIFVDGKALVRDGEIVVNDADWLDDYRAVSVPDDLAKNTLECRLAGQNCPPDTNGRLQREMQTSTGRVSFYLVGQDITALLAARAIRSLAVEEWTNLGQIAEAIQEDLATTYQIVRVLNAYELVIIRTPATGIEYRT